MIPKSSLERSSIVSQSSYAGSCLDPRDERFNYGSKSIQPIALYNFPNAPGLYLGYNNSWTYNPKATSGNKWQVPLGLTVGKTSLLGNGDGLDLSLGAYDLTKSPMVAATGN